MKKMLVLAVLASLQATAVAQAPLDGRAVWQDGRRPPAERAAALERELTLDERIALVHGMWPVPWMPHPGGMPAGAIPAAGYVPGVPRLGIPALTETDASLGVTNPSQVRPGDAATALPATLAIAASFDPELAYKGGRLIGAEARAKGFNVLLTGAINLTRDPRAGRNFENYGEDPLLAGLMGGAAIRGAQENGLIATVKHFAINASETRRFWSNSVIDEAALRESDLLAFQIAIERGQPLSVMCGYNLVNGAYGCNNARLLNDILKGEWAYPGFVMSDWGAVKATSFAVNGLDQQSGEEADEAVWFGAPLKAAVQGGLIPAARLSDMVRRILYAQFAAGLFEPRPKPAPIDHAANARIARDIAAEGVVLLKNDGATLPLATTKRTILVIGDYVEKGVLSGGGSSNVTASADQPAVPMSGEGMFAQYVKEQYHPSAPLAAIRARAPEAKVLFDNGRNAAEAARKAALADQVIVFGNQWMTEEFDAPNMDLPRGQSEMIARVAQANRNTVVVLQTGGPVSMPWLADVPAVVQAWYAGQQGGEVIADVLFGVVNPSGRLPMTFPRDIAQTSRPPVLDGADLPEKVQFDVPYPEGADVGYRWFSKQSTTPLFAFGHGLSYTTYRYDNLVVRGGAALTVQFRVTNTGTRAGKDAPQVYLTATPGGAARRLIGFDKVSLKPGESRTVTVTADPRLLGQFDMARHGWRVPGGSYQVAVSRAANDDALRGSAVLKGALLGAGGGAGSGGH